MKLNKERVKALTYIIYQDAHRHMLRNGLMLVNQAIEEAWNKTEEKGQTISQEQSLLAILDSISGVFRNHALKCATLDSVTTAEANAIHELMKTRLHRQEEEDIMGLLAIVIAMMKPKEEATDEEIVNEETKH